MVVAETDGRLIREIAMLHGFPLVPQSKISEIVAQLSPTPGRHFRRCTILKKDSDRRREGMRNKGRFTREFMARVRSKIKGPMRDHPSINWPKIKGEGV